MNIICENCTIRDELHKNPTQFCKYMTKCLSKRNFHGGRLLRAKALGEFL